MAKYLVDCNCGNQLPVDIGQAGSQITCSCGAQLDVPPLRKLRHLATAVAESKPRTARWGMRQGVMTASLILAAALVVASIWNWFTQPATAKFDPTSYQQSIEKRLATMTPADSWQWWIDYYRPLAERGFPIFEAANRDQVQAEIAHRQFFRRTLWIVAAIFTATAAAAAFWPRPQLRVPVR